MSEKTPLCGQIFYENELRGSYLVVKLDPGISLYHHQNEMLMNHAIANTLPFYHRERDGADFLYYEVTSKQPLNKVLARKKVQPLKMIRLLLQITQTLQNSTVYLLDYRHYLLDERYLYVDPNLSEAFLVYCPYSIEKREALKDLSALANHLLIALDPAAPSTNQFMHRMMLLIHEEQGNLNDFQQQLAAIKKEMEAELSPAVEEKTPGKSTDLEEGLKQKAAAPKEKPRGKRAAAAPYAQHSKDDVAAPYTYVPKLKPELKRNIGVFLIVQVLIVVVSLLLFLETNLLLTEGGSMDRLSLFGWFGLMAALDVFLYLKLLKPLASPEEIFKLLKASGKGARLSVKGMKKISSSSKLQQQGQIGKDIDNPPNIPLSSIASAAGNSQKLNQREYEEEVCATRFLDLGVQFPQLVGEGSDGLEIIEINQPVYVIGKLADQVDYVISNQNVSRIHAELRVEKEECFLKDLNSKNGTYLNGTRLQPNADELLKEGDLIRFANQAYRFSYGG